MRFRTRLVAALVALAVPALIALQVMAQWRIAKVVEERTLARLAAEAKLVAWEMEAGRGDLDDLADQHGRVLGLRVSIIGGDGTVLGDSQLDGAALASVENHGGREEVLGALATGHGLAVRRSETVGARMHYVAVRGKTRDGADAVVRLAVPSSELRDTGKVAGRGVLSLTLGLGLAVAVLGWALARRAATPIESIGGLAQSLARGETPGREAAPGASAEVQEITRSLQVVGERLRAQVEELASERNFLRTTLSGMREGLLIVDGEERIVLANSHARAAFPGMPGPLEGRLAVEIVRDPEFLDLLRRALGRGEEGQKRVALFDGRLLELRVVPLEGPGLEARGALALLLDVTQMERLESVRRDFVANVSHELRTPLSSIKAFVETLLDESAPGSQAQSFLEIVHRNARRMEDLVNDLTDLSLIETGAISLAMEDVTLRAIVGEVFEILAAKADGRKVRLVADVPDEHRVRGDARRVTQVLLNLVDNAVKFNRSGGSVTVASREREGSIVVAVTDEGPGVPPEHRENIFHRFYRVPGTSDQTGTGLGLAIVKHLMRLHGGTIDVESTPGKGSTFRVIFPAGLRA